MSKTTRKAWLVALLALSTACGSTVQLTSTSTSGGADQGLGPATGSTVDASQPGTARTPQTGTASVPSTRSGGQAVTVARGSAVAAERAGATIVVARGGEAGGHGEDQVATLPLLQQVLDAVSVPVLAAGGIATARGLAAVLAAGAAGAWVGTAFAGCRESTSSPAARRAMAGADASGTVYGRSFDIAQRLAWPARFGGRALANDFARAWAGRDAELAELAGSPGDGPAEPGSVTARMADARARGDVAMAPVYCGQGVGQILVDVAAADVVAEFARADDLLRAAAGGA
jgi:nitronate monooxygenase